jgi:hypothetical protein
MTGRLKELKDAIERLRYVACRLGWHKWNYPKHNATRNCLRCIRTEAVDPEKGWVQI